MLHQVSSLSTTNPLTAKYYMGITGLAKKLSSRYGQEDNEDDFMQVALEVACRYEPKYNPDKAGFYTFCIKPISSAIYQEFGDKHSDTKTYKIIASAIKKFQEIHNHYPDVWQISEETGLTVSEILSVYYDKYRDVSFESLDDSIEIQSVFDTDGDSWVDEHFNVLTDQELLIIDAIYYNDQSAKAVANSLKLSTSKLEELHSSALSKLKFSIGDYK